MNEMTTAMITDRLLSFLDKADIDAGLKVHVFNGEKTLGEFTTNDAVDPVGTILSGAKPILLQADFSSSFGFVVTDSKGNTCRLEGKTKRTLLTNKGFVLR